ncbi:exosome complex component MTR3-like [Tropilaelaps mercedesae]|uniref:Exosome complex component MTR3-like n=1 Tax=Tropilaelaps mercedesae TaxID=418985 RepID=A0A1V9Y0F3_9ACAR|nr:exosome complex component MTR3-like [Tropilaelaps mercedesae]
MNSDRKTKAPASVPYQTFQQHFKETKELLERADGRSDEDLKPRMLEVGLVSEASGSGFVEHGSTKVIAAVFGPREVTRRKEFSLQAQLRCVFKYAPYANTGVSARGADTLTLAEQRNSQWLEEALRPVVQLRRYPKAAIDIQVVCLENDGGALSCSLTACGLALASSGIEVFDLVIGTNLRAHGDRILMDPTQVEEDLPAPSEGTFGNVTIGFMPVLRQITGLLQTGDSEPASLAQHVGTLVKVADQVRPLVNECLVNFGKLQEKLSSLQLD